MNSVLRSSLLASVFGASAMSLASFDLMLLPGNDGRIYRYDPVNNVQLGSFAASTSNNMIAANTAGVSYSNSSGGSGLRAHNFATGELQGIMALTVQTRALELANGSLWALANNTLSRYNTTSGTLVGATTLPTGTTWHTMAMSNGYALFVGANTSNAITMTSLNLTTLTTSTIITTTVTIAAGSAIGKATAVHNSFTGSRSIAFSYMDDSGLRMLHNPLTSVGSIGASSVSSSTLAGTNGFSANEVMPAMVAGHGGFYIVGQDVTTPSTVMRVTRYDMYTQPINTATSAFNVPGGSFDLGGGRWHPANVVAPEPGTLVACGAGLCALLRRRRKC